jgi:O-antigen/teichoic acid export membrane protein
LLGAAKAVTPERLYMATLAVSGCAALASVALPPAQRGQLAACIASATMGSAIGGFSVDTFLLSRPTGWILSRGRWRLLALATCCVCLSAAVAALLTVMAGVGSYPVALAGAGVLTTFNIMSSLALRLKRFLLVYSMRAIGAVVLISGYASLYVGGVLNGARWSIAWLVAQSLAAVVMCAWVLQVVRRFGISDTGDPVPPVAGEVGEDLTRMGKLHVGVCAQMLTYRLDQILLARFAGPGPLGVYALAVAALEFAQAGAVVGAQRILANRESTRGSEAPGSQVGPVVKAAVPVAIFSVAMLAVLGLLVPSYREAWLAGLLLLPGSLAVSAGKTWSANLLKGRGEQATTTVALVTLAVAVPCYLILVPWLHMLGAALASSCAYTVYALRSRIGLRRPEVLREKVA